MSLPIKTWYSPNDSQQKFLSAALAYGLSKRLNRRQYETVNESHIDLFSLQSDIADVIVYDLNNKLKPVIIIEFCNADEIQATLRTVEIISEIYGIREAFVVNTSNEHWYRIASKNTSIGSKSDFFKFDLREMLNHSLQNYF